MPAHAAVSETRSQSTVVLIEGGTADGGFVLRIVLSGSERTVAAALSADGTVALVVDPGGGTGDYAELHCNRYYGFNDGNATLTYQHQCGGSVAPWSIMLSPPLQAIIVGPVYEVGMSWIRNGTTQGRQHDHTEPASYLFHGTFNPLYDNDYFTYSDTFSFAVNVGGHTGTGTLHVRGGIRQLPTS